MGVVGPQSIPMSIRISSNAIHTKTEKQAGSRSTHPDGELLDGLRLAALDSLPLLLLPQVLLLARVQQLAHPRLRRLGHCG